MSQDAFFVELQNEFLTEAAFLLESYEESMLGLETGHDRAGDLSQIFRIAHSIKGGAAAVGLQDLGKFAHIVEDLLAVLRTYPDLVNPEVISLLLKSGDQLKARVNALRSGDDSVWEKADLAAELVEMTESFTGGAKTSSASVAEAAIYAEPTTAETAPSVSENVMEEDVTNHELLAELMANLSPEDIAELNAKEQMQAAALPPSQTLAQDQAKVEVTNVTELKKAAAKPTSSSGSGSNKSQTSSIKVDTGRVDSVLDAVGELVVLKNQIVHDDYIRSGENLRLAAIVDQLDMAVRELYEKTLSIRMTPLKTLFVKIQRIVRDVSINLDKPVNLELIGDETEVERTVFELLNDPLVHLVRNALDHGIERKEIRQERGKPAVSKLTVSARQSGGNVIIDIIDDGGGINREKILKKAIERGLLSDGEHHNLTDEQVYQYIFAPGFSTAEKVSDLSGRGVGLDVVRSNIEKINGKINIYSKPLLGSTFRLTLPLSTAITDGIVVSQDGARYILPIHSIREIVRAQRADFTEISGAGRVVKIRNVLMPVIDVEKTVGKVNWENNHRDENLRARNATSLFNRHDETMLVILDSVTSQMALPVDDVLGQAQVVVKPITTGDQIAEVAGAAIMGDGRTILVLDPSAIAHRHGMKEHAA